MLTTLWGGSTKDSRSSCIEQVLGPWEATKGNYSCKVCRNAFRADLSVPS